MDESDRTIMHAKGNDSDCSPFCTQGRDKIETDPVLLLFSSLRKARLCGPALLLLEMHKPLHTLFHAGAIVIQPFLILLFGPALVETALKVLESPQDFDRLTALLKTALDGEGS